MTNQNEEFTKQIETLVDMAITGKKNNIDALKTELSEVTEKMNALQDQLSELKNTPSEVYFDESASLDDQTSAVKLRKAIRDLKQKSKAKQTELDKLKKEEATLSKKFQARKNSLNILETSISEMNSRLNEVNSEETKESYRNSISSSEATKAETKEAFDKINEEYTAIQEQITSLASEITSIDDLLTTKSNNLEEIEKNLDSEEHYIDQTRKNSDDQKIANLEAEIAKLEIRKNEIVKDPVLLGNQAIESYLDGDITRASQKAHEISDIAVEKNPYINESNRESLTEALSLSEKKRDDFYASIEGKSYLENNNGLTTERLSYLDKRIADLQAGKDDLQAKINSVDLDEKYNITSLINNVMTAINMIKDQISSYEEMLESIPNDELAKKASVTAAIDKRKKELENAQDLLDSYNLDRNNDIKEVVTYEQNMIKIEEDIKTIQEEKATLEKELNLESNAKDLLQEQKDKDELAKLAKDVMDIKKALKYDKPITEIVKAMDDSLGTFVTPTYEVTEEPALEVAALDNQNLEETNEVEETKEEVTEEFVDTQVQEETPTVEPVLEASKEAELVTTIEDIDKSLEDAISVQEPQEEATQEIVDTKEQEEVTSYTPVFEEVKEPAPVQEENAVELAEPKTVSLEEPQPEFNVNDTMVLNEQEVKAIQENETQQELTANEVQDIKSDDLNTENIFETIPSEGTIDLASLFDQQDQVQEEDTHSGTKVVESQDVTVENTPTEVKEETPETLSTQSTETLFQSLDDLFKFPSDEKVEEQTEEGPVLAKTA